MENVATYVRVSCHSNAENAARNQAKRVNDYCEAKGYLVNDSAMVIGDRKMAYPMLMNLLKTAKEKGIQKIVMASSNRIVGTIQELQEIQKAFEESGVTIETLDGSYEHGLNADFVFASLCALAGADGSNDSE